MADLQNDKPGQQPLSESCTTYASLLTALFDEEIDESAARLARGHLERCARCADMWQAWESNRTILQAAPAPLPPVTLLARILLACRLVALTRRNGQPHASGQPRAVHTHSRNETVAYAKETVAPSFLDVPAPPSDLQESILRLTTRREENPLAEIRPLVDVQPVSIESREPHRMNWLRSRGGRFAALAVPAVLLWVTFISPTTEVPMQTAVSESTVSEATETLVSLPDGTTPIESEMSKALGGRTVSRAKQNPIAASGKIAPVVSAKVKKPSTAPLFAAVKKPVVTMEAEPEIPVLRRVVARRSHDEDSETPVRTRRPEVRVQVERVAELPEIAPKARPKTVTAAAVNASLTSAPARSAIRVARYVRPVTPRTTTVRENIIDPAETGSSEIDVLREVHGMSEGRSDDVRQVVEDYRESLISEISDSSDDEGSFTSEEF